MPNPLQFEKLAHQNSHTSLASPFVYFCAEDAAIHLTWRNTRGDRVILEVGADWYLSYIPMEEDSSACASLCNFGCFQVKPGDTQVVQDFLARQLYKVET
jgi:hypothetical protein